MCIAKVRKNNVKDIKKSRRREKQFNNKDKNYYSSIHESVVRDNKSQNFLNLKNR